MVQQDFVDRMQAELAANQHKGCWEEWTPSKLEAISDLHYHMSKLLNSLTYEHEKNRVGEYCADCSNILMKIYTLYK